MRVKTSLLLLLALTGCASLGDDLASLRAKKPAANDFNSSLASEYLAYAEARAEENHPIRADHFAAKGLTALDGGDVELEESSEFSESRQTLLAVLTDDIKEIAPSKAARGQILFDCMVEEGGICKESFAHELKDLQFIADALVHGENNRFAVGFAASSATLTAQGTSMLDIVANRVSKLGDYQLAIESSAKKQKLNHLRVLAVEKGLIARGVDAGKIEEARKHKGEEVSLSTDKRPSADTVVISISTYVPPKEAATP